MKQTRWLPRFGILKRTIMVLLVCLLPLHPAAAETPRGVEWQLHDTKVIHTGTLVPLAEGDVRTGITVVGRATAMDQAAASEPGIFSATLTAFTPSADMPGQKKGFWYLNGNWTITAADAGVTPRTSRGNSVLLAGVIKATLPFDPGVGTGMMEADVRLQQRGMSPRAWRMAQGSFSGTTHLEGRLAIPAVPSITTYGRNKRE